MSRSQETYNKKEVRIKKENKTTRLLIVGFLLLIVIISGAILFGLFQNAR